MNYNEINDNEINDNKTNNNKTNNNKISNKYNQIECSICMEKMNNISDNFILCCNHIFHKKCILTWCNYNKNSTKMINGGISINGSCPLCGYLFVEFICDLNNINNNINNNCCCVIL